MVVDVKLIGHGFVELILCVTLRHFDCCNVRYSAVLGYAQERGYESRI